MHRDRKCLSDYQGLGVGVGRNGMIANGCETSFRGYENIPKLDCGDDCTTVHIVKITELYPLNG